jgi:hypothetical protein
MTNYNEMPATEQAYVTNWINNQIVDLETKRTRGQVALDRKVERATLDNEALTALEITVANCQRDYDQSVSAGFDSDTIDRRADDLAEAVKELEEAMAGVYYLTSREAYITQVKIDIIAKQIEAYQATLQEISSLLIGQCVQGMSCP